MRPTKGQAVWWQGEPWIVVEVGTHLADLVNFKQERDTARIIDLEPTHKQMNGVKIDGRTWAFLPDEVEIVDNRNKHIEELVG